MDELFRFSVVRSAQSVPDGTGIDLGTNSSFQQQLAKAAGRASGQAFIGVRGGSTLTELATNYLASTDFSSDPATLQLGPQWVAFRDDLVAHAPVGFTKLEAAVKKAFGVTSAHLLADSRFSADDVRAKDSITAAYISPAGHRKNMSRVADAVRSMRIVRELVAQAPWLGSEGGLTIALNQTLVVSTTVLPSSATTIRPAGITDLLVVRQHINRYQKAEIETIENVMLGESRRKTVRDQTTTQTTSTTESATTTQVTKETDSTERFTLQNEIDKALQEQLGVKAGASVSYHGGTVDASVNASVDYSQSKSESQKIASDYAREVVSKAATQVTTTTKQQLIQQFTEVMETLEDHSFDNSKGKAHISAVYQWLNKVYTAQIFNYGSRLIYDVIVPEPALQWIAAFANLPSPTGITPEPPPVFDVDPSAITPANFEKLAQKFRASGVPAPPPAKQGAAATAIMTKDQPSTDAMVTLKVPDGYVAREVWVSCEYDWSDPANGLALLFGEANISFVQNEGPKLVKLDRIMATADVAVGILAYHLSNYSISFRVSCELLPEGLQAWQQQVFDKLLAGWSSWRADYQDALSKQQQALQAAGNPTLGGNPDQNRAIERTEVKRSFLQLLLGNFNLSGVDTSSPNFPHPKLPDAIAQGEYVRFFEQAFEWEQVSYVLYPYFWGDQGRWLQKLQLATDDPLFQSFLRAGSARVVVSVRPGFETALDYFFTLGQLWGGGGPPPVSSPLYLAITEELKEQSGAPGNEKPYGDPWEISLPTSMIRLRTDDKLPTWAWPDQTQWTWKDGTPTD